MGRSRKNQTPEDVMVIIDRMVAEVAATEADLRNQIIGLIGDGKIEDAVGLLRAWNEMSAGDVLIKNAGIKDGRQG